ncbi:MAG TPA: ABC transporter permease subunit [Ignavibacteriaceae bacterium]|nr:ABC transporter permease subunit [Ignavibacteriaceae bacterium]
MKNMMLMILYTLRESFARKVFIFFFGLSCLSILITAIIFSLVDQAQILQSFLSKGNIGAGNVVMIIELGIVSPLASIGLLLSIFSASSFIPVLLEKGNIDLFLSKPISRTQLIMGKYLGGLLVVLLNVVFLVLGIWIIISLKFSYWNPSFLWTIAVITFTFAVLYSLILFFGIITKGSLLGMMSAYFIFIILSPLLLFFKDQLNVLIKSDFIKKAFEILYYIIPKTQELMAKINYEIARGQGISDFQPVISSFLFLILMLFFSILLFQKKDF